jgi:hypothetical protein
MCERYYFPYIKGKVSVKHIETTQYPAQGISFTPRSKEYDEKEDAEHDPVLGHHGNDYHGRAPSHAV